MTTEPAARAALPTSSSLRVMLMELRQRPTGRGSWSRARPAIASVPVSSVLERSESPTGNRQPAQSTGGVQRVRDSPKRDSREPQGSGQHTPSTARHFAQPGAVLDLATPEERWPYRRCGAPWGIHRQPHCPRSILRQDRHDRKASEYRVSTRDGTDSKPSQEQGIWFKARIAKAVGTTQLIVSGNHGQPYLSGSKRTWRSAVRNFHFQNQFDSLPAQFSSQWMARSLAGIADTRSRRAMTANEVT